MSRRTRGRLLSLSGPMLCCLAGLLGSGSGAKASPPADLTELATGSGPALISTNMALGWNPAWTSVRLQLDFGFATQETNTPGTFLDAFSLSLQNQDRSATALLLTADYWGVAWGPANPGGLSIDPSSIAHTSIPYPNLTPAMDLSFAYTVSLTLPAGFAGSSPWLVLDLFDNGNAFSSQAFLDNFQLVPATETSPGPAFALQSSASPQGPFADENGVGIDAPNKTLTVPLYGYSRFYRLQSDSQVTISRLSLRGSDLVFSYEFQSPVLVLQAAQSIGGPYVDATDARVDLSRRTISLSGPVPNRFYRLRSNLRTLIVSSRISQNELQIEFQFWSSVLSLQSSASVNGPYASEWNVIIDPAKQTATHSRLNSMRLFRIRSPQRQHITRIRVVSDKLVIDYE